MRGTTAWFQWPAVVLMLLAVAACGDGEGGRRRGTLGIDDGASRGVSKSAEVSTNKGAHIALSTGAALDVPIGAVDKDVKLTMERPADEKAVELVERFKKDQDRIVSAPYVLTPHGTKFKEEVSVTLPVSKKGDRELSVAWLEDENDSEWKLLGVAKSDGNTAEIKLKHFSVLVLVEDGSDLPPIEEPGGDEPSAPDAEVVEEDAGSAVLDAGAWDDAGEVAPVRDAGVGQLMDASIGETLDATPALPDAGAATPDAGAVIPDAGAVTPDAGDEEPDAAPVPPDAGVVSEAGAGDDDAGVGPGDGGQEAGVDAVAQALQSMYLKLLECGAVAQTGTFSDQLHNDPINTCFYGCMAQGDCNDAVGTVCDLSTDGGSPGAQACIANCYPFVCPDQQPAVRCNETPECANGEDEQGCGGQFTCGAMTLPYALRCNAMFDCADQSDESGCFLCDGNGTVLKPEQRCDGLPDCYDGMDEPASCAEIACPAPQ